MRKVYLDTNDKNRKIVKEELKKAKKNSWREFGRKKKHTNPIIGIFGQG